MPSHEWGGGQRAARRTTAEVARRASHELGWPLRRNRSGRWGRALAFGAVTKMPIRRLRDCLPCVVPYTASSSWLSLTRRFVAVYGQRPDSEMLCSAAPADRGGANVTRPRRNR